MQQTCNFCKKNSGFIHLDLVSNTNVTTQKEMRVSENEESSAIGKKAVDLRNKSTSILQPINGNSAVRDDTSKDQNTGTVCGEKQFDNYEIFFINLDASISPKQISTKLSREVLNCYIRY